METLQTLKRFTIDTNCIVDVEERRPNAKHIEALRDLHLSKKIELAVVGIAASERQKHGPPLRNINDFLERLARLQLDELTILKPIGVWDLTFWDWSVWSGPELQDRQRELHSVLFPNEIFDHTAYCESKGIAVGEVIDQKWRNRKCDVLTLLAHIMAGHEFFVTGDRNFLKASKKAALENLGAKKILRPEEIEDIDFE